MIKCKILKNFRYDNMIQKTNYLGSRNAGQGTNVISNFHIGSQARSKCKKQGESILIFAHLICAAIWCYLFLETFREREAQSTLSSSFQKIGKSTSRCLLLLVPFYLLSYTLGWDTCCWGFHFRLLVWASQFSEG